MAPREQKAVASTIAAYHARPALRSSRSRSATTSTASAWRVPPIRAGARGSRISTPRSASRSLPRSATTTGAIPTAPPLKSSTRGRRRPGGCRRAYYTFTAGPVQFFALDTQSVALAQKQREWLDRELAQEPGAMEGRLRPPSDLFGRQLRGSARSDRRRCCRSWPIASTSTSAGTITTCRRSRPSAASGSTSPAAAAPDCTR